MRGIRKSPGRLEVRRLPSCLPRPGPHPSNHSCARMMFLCNATTVAALDVSWKKPCWEAATPSSRCADMSRSIDSSSSRMLPSPITSFVTPSSSFSTNPIHDIYSLAASYLQAPPPPYTPSTAFHPHNASQLLLLHNMSATAQVSDDVDIDVVGLTDTTNMVSLNDNDEKEDEEKLDQTTASEESDRISISTVEENPLDLSYKPTLDSPTSSSFAALRPSVIIDHHVPKSHTSVRRSMSSVSSCASSTSTQEEVAAHFRRSLSGKWPKRCKMSQDEARNSPLRRRPSFNTHTSVSSLSVHSVSPTPPNPPTQTIIVNNHCSDTSLSVADHFRRALFGKGIFDWQKKSNQ